MSSAPPAPLVERLKQRKLVQWGLAYLAGSWLLLQVLSLLAQPFAWPDLVMRAAVVLLGIGFFAVLVLAWYHGERGEQRVSSIELLMLTGILVVAGAAVALVSGAGVTAVIPTNALEKEALDSPASPGAGSSIAVLPFDNLSSNAENAYFADGVMEDILTGLSQIQDLRVIARTSVEGYRDTTKPLREIARELGVAHVVEGSVRRQGERVRVTAQLIRASDEAHLWAKNFDRELTDVFAVQSEISQEIAEALRIRLSQGEQARLERKPTENLEAYDLYLRGRELGDQRSREGDEGAIRLYRRALELDPAFHMAAVALAGHYAARTFRYGAGPEWADSAFAMLERVLALEPDLAAAHNTLGVALDGRGEFDRAAVEYRRALELEPSHGWATNNLGTAASRRGDLAEALGWYERAKQLEPRGFLPRANAIGVRLRLHDLDGAESGLREYVERFPERADDAAAIGALIALARGKPQDVLSFAQAAERAPGTGDNSDGKLGGALAFSGRTAEAAVFLERTVASGNLATTVGVNAAILLGYLRLQAGDRGAAEELFAHPLFVRDIQRVPLRDAEYTRASLAAARGRDEEALQHLERAGQAGWNGWVFGHYNPLFGRLRDNPRYEAVMARAKARVDEQRAEAKRMGL